MIVCVISILWFLSLWIHFLWPHFSILVSTNADYAHCGYVICSILSLYTPTYFQSNQILCSHFLGSNVLLSQISKYFVFVASVHIFSISLTYICSFISCYPVSITSDTLFLIIQISVFMVISFLFSVFMNSKFTTSITVSSVTLNNLINYYLPSVLK